MRGILTGAALGIAVLLVFAFIRIAADYSGEFQLESAATAEARLAAADGRSDGGIRDAILQKAQALGLPVDEHAINVQITPPAEQDQNMGHFLVELGVQKSARSTGHVEMAVSYDVPHRNSGGIATVHFRFAVTARKSAQLDIAERGRTWLFPEKFV
ncbi:MAG: hypothetical protein KGL75_00685 [Acidobacteriota bacterium]|nr:hypothetical protein [Acidobacteriota bacterium]